MAMIFKGTMNTEHNYCINLEFKGQIFLFVVAPYNFQEFKRNINQTHSKKTTLPPDNTTLSYDTEFMEKWTERRCLKITDIYGGEVSKDSVKNLHTVMNVLKCIPMKCLSNFQKRAVGTPSTLLGKHVNRLSNPLESQKNSIQDILNLINLNKPTVSDAFEEAENINSE